MRNDLFMLGDRVYFQEDRKEDEKTNTNPKIPATIIGYPMSLYPRWNGVYDGRKPGFYQSMFSVIIRFNDGEIKEVYYGNIDHIDPDNLKPSIEERKLHPKQTLWLASLPNTGFWELDIVKIVDRSYREDYNKIFQVQGINYCWNISNNPENDSYQIAPMPDKSYTMNLDAHSLKLVSRGNLWKWYHGEDVYFNSIEEEAYFYKGVGLMEERRNPKNGLYSWTIEDALQALKDGYGHAISQGNGVVSAICGKSFISVYKCINDEVGKRIAEKTLKGFCE